MQGSLAETIRQYWLSQGWPLADLGTFRMDGNDPDDPDDPDPDPDPDPDDKKFTQEDVKKIAAKEKKEGKAAAQRELMEKFGVKTVDELEELVKKQREADDAHKTETERAAAKAKADEEEAAKAKAEAATDRRKAKVERALMKAGITEEDELEMVVDMVKVEDDADADTISEAVEELKKKMPRLFDTEPADDQDPKGRTPKPGDPGPKPRKKPPQDPKGRAKQLLAERHPQTVKS